MDLEKNQELLAALYTDEVLRSRFFANPERMAPQLGLDADGLAWFKSLDASEIAYLSQTLINKEYNEASPWIPGVCLALGPRAKKLFQRYLGQRDASRHASPKQHAQAFLNFLKPHVRNKSAVPPCVPDIVRYEQCRLAAEGPLFIGLLWLSYPAKDWLQALHYNGDLRLIGRRPAMAAWCKLPGLQRPLHFTWAFPIIRLDWLKYLSPS